MITHPLYPELMSNSAHAYFCQVFMDPRLGTAKSGPAEAVFAIRFNGKPNLLIEHMKFHKPKQIEHIGNEIDWKFTLKF